MVSFCDSYADKDKSGIRVAQYVTELPSKEVLLRQLQKFLAVAKETNQSHPSDWKSLSQGCKLPTDKRKKSEKKHIKTKQHTWQTVISTKQT